MLAFYFNVKEVTLWTLWIQSEIRMTSKQWRNICENGMSGTTTLLFGINSWTTRGDILKIRVKDARWYIKIKEQKTGKRKQLKMTKTLKKKSESTSKICHYITHLFQKSHREKQTTWQTDSWLDIEDRSYRVWNWKHRHPFDEKNIWVSLLQKTKDVAMLMDLFNHSSPAITLRYIGIRQDQRDKSHV